MQVKVSNMKSCEERVADTYWPLIIYKYRMLYGSSISRVMAHFLGCQPTSLFKDKVSKLKRDNIKAFLSPTYRRRFRNSIKRALKADILEARRQGTDVRRMGRETLFQMYEGWREELSSSNIEELSNGEIKADWPPLTELDLDRAIEAIDLSRIPKFNQLEKEAMREANEIAEAKEEVAEFFPIHLTIDPRHKNETLMQVGSSGGYAATIADFLAQIKFNPQSIEESPSAIKTLLRVFPLKKELEKAADLPQVFRVIGKVIARFMVLSMTPRGKKIVRKMVGNMLVDHFLEQPYTQYGRESLEETAERGIELADSQVEEQFSRREERAVLESSLEELPAAQREDSRFLLEHSGESPKELRQELGEKKYKAKKRNFERGLRRLRELSKSGKLG